MLQIIFEIRPEYINTSDRELTYSQLTKFENLEDARNYVVEKEIDTLLRKSHTDHFIYLEKKLNMNLRKLPIWKDFIEITQRRHLFAHCDGVVSSQYIQICKENKCLSPEIILNKRLSISEEYFEKTYNILYELATKLTHTLWRKLLKKDLKEADRRLNDICIDLINSKQLLLSDEILDFACKQNDHSNDANKNVFIINKALSKFLSGDKELAKKIVNEKDWSASSDDFKLAHLTLNEKYDEVYEVMDKIGNNGEIDKEDYKTWPLFSALREEKTFKDKYKKIFDEEYSILDVPNRPIQDLIEKLIKTTPDIKQKLKEKQLSNKRMFQKEEEEE